MFDAVQFRMQRTDPATVLWGDMVTTGCQLLSDGPWAAVGDGDHMLAKQAYFGVPLDRLDGSSVTAAELLPLSYLSG